MEQESLGNRYNRLWQKAEWLVEAFLDKHLASLNAEDDAQSLVAMRELYTAVQCLKRIHDGRRATVLGDDNAIDPSGPEESDQAIAQEISRRLQELSDTEDADGDDEDSV